jgi:hypothetical protein
MKTHTTIWVSNLGIPVGDSLNRASAYPVRFHPFFAHKYDAIRPSQTLCKYPLLVYVLNLYWYFFLQQKL